MKKRILIGGSLIVVLFFVTSGIKVLAAGSDANLTAILNAGAQGLQSYFDFLLGVLDKIW